MARALPAGRCGRMAVVLKRKRGAGYRAFLKRRRILDDGMRETRSEQRTGGETTGTARSGGTLEKWSAIRELL